MAPPTQNPKESGNLRRMKKGEPFDPDELSRLLTIHLEEQKLKSELRRAARVAKAAAAPFVPMVAAAAFERTTTPDVMRQVHKLSLPAVKQHSEVLQVNGPSLGSNQALDQAVIERDLLRNRNQWQWTQDMRDAAAVDLDRDLYRPPQRTFAESVHLMNKTQDEWSLRDAGFVCWEDVPASPTVKAKPKYAFDGRNDWAQRDSHGAKQMIEKGNPVRKRDSIWILRSRKDNSMRNGKDNVVTGIESCGSSPDRNRSGRRSFLPTVFHRLRSY